MKNNKFAAYLKLFSEKYRRKVVEWSKHPDRPDGAFAEKMNTDIREDCKKRKIDDLEITEMFCPFVRGIDQSEHTNHKHKHKSH